MVRFYCIKLSKYYPESYEPFGGDIKVKVDLSNYATKADIKNISHIDKTEVDKLDIDKLAPVPTDLSEVSNVVKHDVVKKTVYGKLITKVNDIDINDFVLKTKYDADKSELENNIPNVTDPVKKTDYSTKLIELENTIPDISNLATKKALTSVENKILDVSNLLKKTDYKTKITEIENKVNNHNHDKYIDAQEFNKLAADAFNARLAQTNLITKTDFDARLSNLNRKITANKSKHLLVENELNKLKTFDSSYFIGKKSF